MRVAAVIAVLGTLAAGTAAAYDEMEMQRCVWRCLADHGPAENPAYSACVASVCSERAPAAGTQAAPAGPAGAPGTPAAAPSAPSRAAPGSGWTVGTEHAGITAFAGMDEPGGGRGLYYYCNREGRSQLMASDYRGGAAALDIDTSGERYSIRFHPGPGGLFADIPPATRCSRRSSAARQ